MLDRSIIEQLHPGVCLREDYLADFETLGITRYRIAKELHITQSQLDALLSGRRNITANLALRLGKLLNQSPEMWLGLQNKYDLRIALLEYPDIETIVPLELGVDLSDKELVG